MCWSRTKLNKLYIGNVDKEHNIVIFWTKDPLDYIAHLSNNVQLILKVANTIHRKIRQKGGFLFHEKFCIL